MLKWGWLGLGLALLLTACGGEEISLEPEPTNPLATPRASVEHQLGLLVAGDIEALRACFTPRLQDRITAEAVAEGAKEAGSMTIDDLFASMEEGEFDGKQTAKVKMKNGRTLTTLVLTDGRWLADTIWFR